MEFVFPDGSTCEIQDVDDANSWLEIKEFVSAGGAMGAPPKLNKINTLSNPNTRYEASLRTDAGERSFKWIYVPNDPGQIEVIRAADAKEKRTFRNTLPNGQSWQIDVTLAGKSFPESEEDKPMELEVFMGVNNDGGLA